MERLLELERRQIVGPAEGARPSSPAAPERARPGPDAPLAWTQAWGHTSLETMNIELERCAGARARMDRWVPHGIRARAVASAESRFREIERRFERTRHPIVAPEAGRPAAPAGAADPAPPLRPIARGIALTTLAVALVGLVLLVVPLLDAADPPLRGAEGPRARDDVADSRSAAMPTDHERHAALPAPSARADAPARDRDPRHDPGAAVHAGRGGSGSSSLTGRREAVPVAGEVAASPAEGAVGIEAPPAPAPAPAPATPARPAAAEPATAGPPEFGFER